MAIEYLACGNVMTDMIALPDGTISEKNMGGDAVYALSGMRLWSPNCTLVSHVGADYEETYGTWMDENGMPRTYAQVAAEHCSAFVLQYAQDGSFTPVPVYSYANKGYLKVRPEDIEAACSREAVKAIYTVQYTDRVIWGKIAELKKKYGFQIMWEIEFDRAFRTREGIDCTKSWPDVERTLQIADMFSINHNEAADLFGIPRDDDAAMIRRLQQLPVAFTLYRVGSRGTYVVSSDEVLFCGSVDPYGASVDPTGCGNTSTGAAMQAYASGDSLTMVAAKACVAAGFNAAQRGPIPRYTPEKLALAQSLAASCCENDVRVCLL